MVLFNRKVWGSTGNPGEVAETYFIKLWRFQIHFYNSKNQFTISFNYYR